jgi:2-oxoglutarate dehydrogenase E1 component
MEVHNTPLIEHAVACFEYGISMADPRRLVVWEAQFGEFLNYSQAVFDQCIACGEDRWLRSSGLVILLPHGLDGGGPDHSTGRPERLLAACAGANLQVVNASTPASFFHVLRRQMHRPFRKPLVVLSPKALLRTKACVSTLADFAEGTSFRAVIPDAGATKARRVVMCTGKVYYELAEARAARGLEQSVALVRLEQLYPLPEAEIRAALAPHPGAELIWCEEEPENMGYFTWLDRRLERIADRTFRRAGRPAAATPAVGVKYWHEAEIKAFVEDALGGVG